MVRKNLILAGLFLIVSFTTIAQNGSSTFEFIENKGQWDARVKFKGELASGDFYLHQNGFTIAQHNPEDLARIHRHPHTSAPETNGSRKKRGKNQHPGEPGNPHEGVLRSHAYRVTFLNAASASIQPDKAITSYNNYFIGNDPSKWASHVKIYQAVTYKNIYPDIDLRYYSENGYLKYDLIVHPGGDLGQVALRYEGADKLVLKNNQLIIKTSVGDVKELSPYSYQFDKTTGKKEIACRYELRDGNTVYFRAEDYDRNATLIVDPTLVFSTFTRSTADNWGFTATYGPDGSLFAGGIVFDRGFPTSTGAYQQSYIGLPGSQPDNNKVDVGIMKFSPNGSQRIYATYLGHNEDEFPHSLVCDAAGNLVILGRTYSAGFPNTAPRVGGQAGGCDIFVTKLNANGDDLIGSFLIGGQGDDGVNIEDQYRTKFNQAISLLRNYGDDGRSEVILDNAGNIYVAAQTLSGSDFPIRGTVFQPTPGGKQDGVVIKINPDCNNVLWSSFLGGSEDDAAFVLALHPVTNEVFVAGGTSSRDIFPASNPPVHQNAYQEGIADGYVAVISNDGATLERGTYLGTTSTDIVYGIQFDRHGFPYVMGVSRGNWTVTPVTVYQNPGSKQFVSKLQPDLSGFVYSTVFGSGSADPDISPVAFLVDRCENVYISGWGGNVSGSNPDPYGLSGTASMPITPDAIKSTTDTEDFYFIVLSRDAQGLLYGSYFGQSGGVGEHVDGGTSRFDSEGVIYMAICANCGAGAGGGPFPTTPGVWGPNNPSNNCNLAAVKISFNYAGVGSGPKTYINNTQDTSHCVPVTVTFRDTVRNARKYIWDFGDGSGEVETNDFEISHTYNTVGTYTIRLIAIDSTTCNIVDTAYATFRARNDEATLAFDATKQEPCEALSYLFENNSAPAAGKPFTDSSFIWDFGDGTRIVAGPGTITRSYANPGIYTVKLILTDTNYCNAPDSLQFTLSVSAVVKAQFETPPSGCAPYEAVFNNTSLGGEDYFWDFGDGNTSTAMNPTHVYSNTGTYEIKLVVVDSNTCNIIDSTTFQVTVNPLPTADFNTTPVPAVQNTPTVFYNLSTGGSRYKWLFGDGDSAIRTTMDTVMHQYNATGTYEACLITYNEFDCTDTVCKPVQALVVPLLDVPNAFTPGRGGQNSVIKVEGFGIGKMIWRIYNRWGQVVFETTNRKAGWDGTFKGQLQPMDVYAYTLDVEFTDGTKLRKTGDITLIR